MFHWMALPGAGPGCCPKMGPLLLRLEEKTSLKHYCCTASAGAGRQKSHILPTPSSCQVSCLDSNHLPFWGGLKCQLCIRAMRTNEKAALKQIFFLPVPCSELPFLQGRATAFSRLSLMSTDKLARGCKATPSSKHLFGDCGSMCH